jgi:hypothetical protein
MAKRFLLLLVIIRFSFAIAQEKSIQALPLSTLKIDADTVLGLDSLDNLYFIKNNTLIKKSKSETWQYKNISLGKITYVKIETSLKIVLFYENFNTIILLDSQLNEIQKINFSENTNPLMVSATGIASQNKLWIYDSALQQIGLYDYLKKIFHPITPSLQGNFKYYDSNINTFQWIDSKLNWNTCDIFGKINTIGKVTDFEQIKAITNKIVILSNREKIYIQDIEKNTIYPIENINKSFKNFYYKDQILSIFTNQEITNYKIIIP